MTKNGGGGETIKHGDRLVSPPAAAGQGPCPAPGELRGRAASLGGSGRCGNPKSSFFFFLLPLWLRRSRLCPVWGIRGLGLGAREICHCPTLSRQRGKLRHGGLKGRIRTLVGTSSKGSGCCASPRKVWLVVMVQGSWRQGSSPLLDALLSSCLKG